MSNYSRLERIAQMEHLLGAGDWETGAQFFTPDVRYRVGAREPVAGIDGIRRYMESQAARIRWTGHTLCWQAEDDATQTAVIEVISHFQRVADDAPIDLPCTDIYRFDGDRICDWRVYADIAILGVT
ncbi:nuclear transport factor 2 family protein [Actibacterium sp. 188UL27-1]|uniref:nuclear transport factor 2 family protein n=1 Tax=Actibacterium sp. 188UL27-1 TaxID=2786961 RepID=UPI00195BC8FB|nr:nuclear transport factor 2 family protein [Actibacterium sp. 188UL27-1]MBM7069560.1 nuclear transport factor 2 family protein [Actibacterium sp. 188UL27-1]